MNEIGLGVVRLIETKYDSNCRLEVVILENTWIWISSSYFGQWTSSGKYLVRSIDPFSADWALLLISFPFLGTRLSKVPQQSIAHFKLSRLEKARTNNLKKKYILIYVFNRHAIREYLIDKMFATATLK